MMTKHGVRLLALIAATVLKQSADCSLANPISLDGTLVLAVPSNEGLVIATDSRMRVAPGVFCDNQYKIIEPDRPDRSVIAVAGAGINVPGPGPDVRDLCAYSMRARRNYDIGALARDYVEARDANIATIQLDELAALCVETIVKFQMTHGLEPLKAFWDKRLFNVVLASYDPGARRSFVKRIGLNLEPGGRPFIDRRDSHNFSQESDGQLVAFGEAEFLNKNVVNGVGQQFLRGAFAEWQKQKTIAEINRSLALNAATDLIEAASKTADLMRYDGGIGGPVDAVLLGEQRRPLRLRWKAP